ncbi:SMP-30/gluconolactonase/LRE family protein [Mycobacterium vicinigordonae]|uniref:SMP-30/gluconolactonase/LRE family protein n=1 Tax=Mycobacterium vicinigordonae TaxID=1719132 RepID=A0A7D6HSH0_9MYCO|nr:SMP-30/gluconolactonase/LRE family protein [Mycobacterium vicinigordonae]QLL05493.1 SMP-30/gluconolactonase/LRE family protein [Mycobacterium vicinigordonae]
MRIEVIADGLGFTEAPVLLADGRIAVASVSHGAVYIVDPNGGPVQRIGTGGGPSGLAVGDDGTIFIAQNGGIWGASAAAPPGIQAITGAAVEYVVADLRAPNDVTIDSAGQLWVTDSGAEFDPSRPQDAQPGIVWLVDVAAARAEPRIDPGPVSLNGIGLRPDESALLLTATLPSQLLSCALPTPTTTQQVHTLCHFAGDWPDGIAVTAAGDIWAAMHNADRIELVGPAGELRDRLDLPTGSAPTNVCCGVEPGELYVTAAHAQSLLRIKCASR